MQFLTTLVRMKPTFVISIRNWGTLQLLHPATGRDYDSLQDKDEGRVGLHPYAVGAFASEDAPLEQRG